MSTESDDAARLKLLLGDIRDVFAKKGAVERSAEISSADLVNGLIAIEGRPWGAMGRRYRRAKPLTQVKLAQMLKPLAIVSDHLGSGTSVRGYKLWQFEEAFLRHLPSERGLSSRRVQELADWYSGQAYWHYSKNALTPARSTPSYEQSCARKCLPGTSRSSSNASDRLAPFSIGSASNVFPA
jgi:hypothetical protein